MKRFEYCLKVPEDKLTYSDITKALTSQGSLGWELCGIDYGAWIFKRELPPADSIPPVGTMGRPDARVFRTQDEWSRYLDETTMAYEKVVIETREALAKETARADAAEDRLSQSHVLVCNAPNRIVGQGHGCICRVSGRYERD
jgi:hypothetical protein